MKIAPNQKLRRNVCMLVYNAKGQLFVGERSDRRKHWQFPQGGVEKNKTDRETVVRELREEIGITKRSIGRIRKLKATHAYLWRTIPAYAVGRWVGQAQTFWLVEFVGKDIDIDLATTKHQEFRNWRWCSATLVKRLVAPERRKGYRPALAEFLALKKAGDL
jgi:putative (di)nucleoside polyphosphate hydrolase